MNESDAHRRYSIGLLYRLLCRLTQEMTRLPDADDIEVIHRARVATRRLRMALMALAGLLTKEDQKTWKNTITHIGQLLGTVRDLDVQIQTLSSLLPEAPIIAQPGLQRLIWRLQTRRKACRPHLQKLLRRLIKQKWLSTAKNSLKRAAHPHHHAKTPNPTDIILGKINRVLYYRKHISQPVPPSPDILHALRKAMRNLRYTLELFDALPEISHAYIPEIKLLKTIQDTLGDMHDCDVWADYLPSFSLEEQQKIFDFSGNLDDIQRIENGIQWFAENRQTLRNMLFNEFMAQWKQLENSAFWLTLIQKVRAHSSHFPPTVTS